MKNWISVALLLLLVGCFRWEDHNTEGGVRESDRFVAADDVNSLRVLRVSAEEFNAVFAGTEVGGLVTLCVEPCVKEENITSHTVFLNAGLKDIRICADKELFAQKAGESITDHFKVVNAYGVVYHWPWTETQGYQTATLNVAALEWNKLFIPHVQCCDFWIQFAEVPAEKYDVITFTVAMDILLPDGGERTLTGSVKVVFE